MLIKIQEHRYSKTYHIMEDVHGVSYIQGKGLYCSEDVIGVAVDALAPRPILDRVDVMVFDDIAALLFNETKKHSEVDANLIVPDANLISKSSIGVKMDFSLTSVHLNHIYFFLDKQSANTGVGQRHHLIFDGEAYICNDDGKTIHKLPAGGYTHHGEENVHGVVKGNGGEQAA